jgi:uncharacterized membrane protein YfcA
MVVGLEYVAPQLSAPAVKMFFGALWLSFGMALLWLNRNSARKLTRRIAELTTHDMMILMFFGMLGGIISGITGSGIDVFVFALLTLGFGVDERVATPTSVVLMASNAIFGFAWRALMSAQPIPEDAWNYWWVCVPVVVVGAPFGASFISRRSRLFVVGLLLTIIITQFAGALVIVPQTRMSLAITVGTIAIGCLFFTAMSWFGQRRLRGPSQTAP